MKRSVKMILSLVAAVATVVCVCCCLYIVQYIRGDSINASLSNLSSISAPPASESSPSSDTVADPPPVPTQPEEEETETNTELTTESLIDFDELEAVNPDIYAWIEIPSLGTNLAVVQSPDNDEYYLRHAATGAYYSGGSIFSQRLNTKTFEDPMTVLYGHNYKNMFGPLNRLADVDAFEACEMIRIYTRERVFEYTVFAAYPYSNRHLLYICDFSDPDAFDAFFAGLDDVPGGNFRRDLFPSSDDRVLTLSTCVTGNRMRRFLVQGVLTAEYTVVP